MARSTFPGLYGRAIEKAATQVPTPRTATVASNGARPWVGLPNLRQGRTFAPIRRGASITARPWLNATMNAEPSAIQGIARFRSLQKRSTAAKHSAVNAKRKL